MGFSDGSVWVQQQRSFLIGMNSLWQGSRVRWNCTDLETLSGWEEFCYFKVTVLGIKEWDRTADLDLVSPGC